MNTEIAGASTTASLPRAPARRPLPRWSDLAASTASALFHIFVLIALLSAAPRHGGRPPSRLHSIVITLVPGPRPVASPAPAKPREPPHPQALLPTPAPTPVRPRKPAAQSKPAPAAARVVPPVPKNPDEVQEMEDVIGRIHENWLEPPGASKTFRCRAHIDYAVGGMITAVRMLQTCGSLVLDDSVRRAIWKTQPVPLLRAKLFAGGLDIDFLP